MKMERIKILNIHLFAFEWNLYSRNLLHSNAIFKEILDIRNKEFKYLLLCISNHVFCVSEIQKLYIWFLVF